MDVGDRWMKSLSVSREGGNAAVIGGSEGHLRRCHHELKWP